MNPEINHRKILLAVSGMSPQIITETLFALLQRESQPWIPDEIHLITTSSGAEQARLQLLQPQADGPGYFHRLLRDYHIEQPIRFDDSSIHLIRGAEGEPLTDLRTPRENELAADFITERVRGLTVDDNCELHVSLAGGRKTMGFYAGYALSLFGRPQDRLSHVLVSPEYESLRDFYYPTPETRVIHRIDYRSGKELSLDAKNAKVWLAEIPVVRLRDYVSDTGLLRGETFNAVVEHVERMTLPPRIDIDDGNCSIRIQGVAVNFSPREYAFYRWFIDLCLQQGEGIVPPPKDTGGDSELARQYLQHLVASKHAMADIDQTRAALADGMDRNYFDSIKARVNHCLATVLGTKGAACYQIQTLGRRPRSRYALTLSADAIVIEG